MWTEGSDPVSQKYLYYFRQWDYVLPDFCLSVCLSDSNFARKKYWLYLRDNFIRDVSVDTEVPIKL